jgi:hypothetical protein
VIVVYGLLKRRYIYLHKSDVTHFMLLINFVYHSVIVVSLIEYNPTEVWYYESPYDCT